jgi:hypothetical protein
MSQFKRDNAKQRINGFYRIKEEEITQRILSEKETLQRSILKPFQERKVIFQVYKRQ